MDKVSDKQQQSATAELERDRDLYHGLWQRAHDQLVSARRDRAWSFVVTSLVSALLGAWLWTGVTSYQIETARADLSQCQRVLLDYAHALDASRAQCGALP